MCARAINSAHTGITAHVPASLRTYRHHCARTGIPVRVSASLSARARGILVGTGRWRSCGEQHQSMGRSCALVRTGGWAWAWAWAWAWVGGWAGKRKGEGGRSTSAAPALLWEWTHLCVRAVAAFARDIGTARTRATSTQREHASTRRNGLGARLRAAGNSARCEHAVACSQRREQASPRRSGLA
jgi:hypothetical protein